MEPTSCPACHKLCGQESMLTAIGICPKCGPLTLYEVTQPRTNRVIYTRREWAPDPETAIKIAEQGNAWPDSYDESTVSSDLGEFSAAEITDENALRAWSHRIDVPLVTDADIAEFLSKGDPDA
jgi:hypothetical protein